MEVHKFCCFGCLCGLLSPYLNIDHESPWQPAAPSYEQLPQVTVMRLTYAQQAGSCPLPSQRLREMFCVLLLSSHQMWQAKVIQHRHGKEKGQVFS